MTVAMIQLCCAVLCCALHKDQSTYVGNKVQFRYASKSRSCLDKEAQDITLHRPHLPTGHPGCQRGGFQQRESLTDPPRRHRALRIVDQTRRMAAASYTSHAAATRLHMTLKQAYVCAHLPTHNVTKLLFVTQG